MAGQIFRDGGDGNTSFKTAPTKSPEKKSTKGNNRGNETFGSAAPATADGTMPTLPPAGAFEETTQDDGAKAADVATLAKGGMIVDREGKITMPGKDGQPVSKTKAELEKEVKAVIEGRQSDWLGPVLSGGAGMALGTILGIGPSLGAAGGLAAYDAFFGKTPEEKKANAEAAWKAALDKSGGNTAAAAAEFLSGTATKSESPANPSSATTTDTNRRNGSTNGEAGATVSPTVQQAIDPVKAAAAAARATEQQRFNDLVKLYNPNAQGFSPIDISAASTTKEAEAVKKTNDLIALSAKSGAIGDKARSDLSTLTKLSPENRDAWLQYYNPSAAVSSASSATAASANASQGQAYLASMSPTDVGPVSQATGQYQTDLSPLTSYDATIAKSDQRQRSVGLADMMEARARGEIPSVAAEQYKASLDRLLQSQQAATASQRGPASALGLRSAQTQAGQLGQQAVRETAILRLQEQKDAEERAAAQSNAIMIEDQKIASQEKVNELSQRIQVVSADLQNTKNILDRDIFNAEAMNKVNMLEAQLRTDVESLNAELGTRASLTNAELSTRAAIENAGNATEAAISNARLATETSMANAREAAGMQRWAGDNAQTALRDQVATERADWTRGYTTTRDSLADQQAALRDASSLMAGAGANDISRQRLSADISKNEADRLALDEAAKARERQSYAESLLEIFKAAKA